MTENAILQHLEGSEVSQKSDAGVDGEGNDSI